MTAGNNHQQQDWEQQLERLSAYLDNELDERERAALEAHLPTCEQCQQALAELRETRMLLRRLPAPALPRAFTLPETGAIPASIATRRTATTAAPATRQRAGSGRLLQWIGSVAAAIGLFFLIGSALGGLHLTPTGASSASAPTHYNSAATRSTPSQQANAHTQQPGIATGSSPVPKTPTSTTAASASPTPMSNPQFTNNAGTPPPVGELAGTVLLVGGAGLLVSGTVLVRRKKRYSNLR